MNITKYNLESQFMIKRQIYSKANYLHNPNYLTILVLYLKF